MITEPTPQQAAAPTPIPGVAKPNTPTPASVPLSQPGTQKPQSHH